MRLIDADEIIEIFEHMEEAEPNSKITLEAAIEIIDDALTVEVYKNISEETEARTLRPCMVNGKKARFHRWSGRSEIIDPSPLMGGHSGGVMQWTAALVEYEDGTLGEVLPKNIRFTDNESEDTE